MTDRLSLRDTYLFDDDDHVWVEDYTCSWPNGVGFMLTVPVPNPPEDKRVSIERQLRNHVSNAMIRIGRSLGAKGKPEITKVRRLAHSNEIPVASWE